jgi:hypothetical protein
LVTALLISVVILIGEITQRCSYGKLSSLAASAAESFALTHWPPSLDILLEHQILNCNSCFGQNHAFHQLLL